MAVFDATDETPTSYLDALVGEGKKFSDPESLARGKWEADRIIAEREAELAELRDKAREAKTVEELLAKIQSQQTNNPTRDPTPEGNQPPEPATLTPDKVQELIRNELNQSKTNEARQANVQLVASKLTDMYGSEEAANLVVKTKAQELGVSVEFLQSVAIQSPKAFFAQLGLDPNSAAPAPAGPTHGQVNPTAMRTSNPGVKPGTYAFYEELRKTNPTLYSDRKTQVKMHEDALRLGEAFF